jgi:outer membrane protein assembly factor BamB
VSAESKQPSRLALRLAAYLFPPAGIVLLWRTKRSVFKRILGTFGLLLYSLPYSALIIFLLIRFWGLKVEWRGGYIPALTWKRTAADYDRLEKSRAQQNRLPPTNSTPTNSNAYWTGFRGPERDGRYDEQPIQTNWSSTGPRLLWRQPCGGGYASFAIAEGLAFTIEQRREKEVVIAYELDTGREVWTNGWSAHFNEPMGGDGPRATPAYSEGHLYALGAEGELRCLEAQTGKSIWNKNILAEAKTTVPTYGVAASPLIVDERLIMLGGAEQPGQVLCYDKHEGKRLWSALNEGLAYASPMLVTLNGERQILVCATVSAVGIRLDDGAVRWKFPWRVKHDQLPIAQPVMLGTNRFMLSGGYFTGATAFEVNASGQEFSTREVWSSSNLKNKFTSSVFYDGFVYGLDEDILTCLDATTGERKWKDGRYGYGQVLLASGHLIVLCGDGDLALVRATSENQVELARFPAIHGKTWNHPAISSGRLLVRNGAEMACFDIAPR